MTSYIDLDLQNLIGSLLSQGPSDHQIWSKPIHAFSGNSLYDQPTTNHTPSVGICAISQWVWRIIILYYDSQTIYKGQSWPYNNNLPRRTDKNTALVLLAHPFHCTYVMYVVCFDFIVLCIISLAFHLLFGPRAASLLLLNWLIDWLIDPVHENVAVITLTLA